MDSKKRSRSWIMLWSVALLAAGSLFPAGSWTIDDALKSVFAERGSGVWGSPVADGAVRARLANPSDFAALAEPFAARAESGYVSGFSPYVRLLFGLTGGSKRAQILFSVVVALAAGWLLWWWGFHWGFVLLPLTFYGLVPWEHGLALLLSLPALYFTFGNREWSGGAWLSAGVLLALAAALRPEHGILILIAAAALLQLKRGRSMLWVSAGFGSGLVLLIVAAGTEEFFRQSVLNSAGDAFRSFGGYLGSRIRAVYDLFFACGPNVMVSILHLLSAGAGLWTLHRKESRSAQIAGWGLLGLYLAGSLYYIWFHPLPPLALLTQGSFLVAMPWVFLLWLPNRGSSRAHTYAWIAVLAGLLMVPLSSGVHWGPRLLLFASPLLLFAVYEKGWTTSRAFYAILLVTAVQTAGSGTLVWARYVETRQHTDRLTAHIGTPVICATRSQAADLAPFWSSAEFFTASTPALLRSLLVQFKEQGLDTVWLHLDAFDSLYVRTFPDAKPVWPHRMTVANSGSVYRTYWRLYRLVMNRQDPLWAPLLEEQAQHYWEAEQMKRALFLQSEAVRLQPGRAESESNLALILMQLSRAEDARAAVGRALRLDSTLVPARVLLSRLDSLAVAATE